MSARTLGPAETTEWMRAEHLDAAPTARYRAALDQSSERVVVLDDVLTTRALTRLQERMGTARYETVYALHYGGRSPREAFQAAPEAERLACFLEIDEAVSASEGSTADRQLHRALSQPELLDFFGRLGGRALSAVSALNGNAYEHGHFLRPHTDSDGGRVLCAVLYLHSEWHASFGGALVFRHGLSLPRTIEPICNRMVVFNPASGALHWVEPVTHPHWQRWSVSFWFV